MMIPSIPYLCTKDTVILCTGYRRVTGACKTSRRVLSHSLTLA